MSNRLDTIKRALQGIPVLPEPESRQGPSDAAVSDLQWAVAEIERLREDIQYALDRLSVESDQGPGLRALIDEATNYGDYFPSSELKRRLDQIHEINRHLGNFLEFNREMMIEAKRLHAYRMCVERFRSSDEGDQQFLERLRHTANDAKVQEAEDKAAEAESKVRDGCR